MKVMVPLHCGGGIWWGLLQVVLKSSALEEHAALEEELSDN